MEENKPQKSKPSARMTCYTYYIPVTISGAGVLSVKSEDILKSPQAQRQLQALKRLKDKGLM